MNKSKAFIRQYQYELIAFVINIISASLSVWLTTPKIAFVMAIAVFTLSIFVVIYFKIKDSHAGYIFPKIAIWDDYKLECDFKIVNTSLGCIVRAVNLSNYVMYQLFYDRIKPHLRINGEWIVTEESSFENKLKPDKWYKLTIICEKRSIRINVEDEKETLFDRHFTIPPQMGVVYRELNQKGEETKRQTQLLQNIDFDFGSAGFRDHGDERAFIKNIYLEKL